MSALPWFRDWLTRPATRVTLIITVLGLAMLTAANPTGTSVDDGLFWLAYAWFGAFFAQLISLGAWAALRDGRWLSRIIPPVALLVIHIVATSVGERLNSEPSNGRVIGMSVTIFGTTYLLFLLLRRYGWRIGPPNEGSSAFSLAQFLLAITFAAAALGIWKWAATDLHGRFVGLPESIHLMEVAGSVLIGTLVTLVICLLVLPAIVVALSERRRYAFWLLGGIPVASLALVLALFTGPGLAPGMLPVALFFTTMWLFNAYRTCGYYFIGQPPPQRPKRRWFFAGVCLAVTGIVLSTWTLRDFRREQPIRQRWAQFGIGAVSMDNLRLLSISVREVTRPGVEALKHEPLLREIRVDCPANSEQIAWLLELRQVEVFRLSQIYEGAPQLRSFDEADHLKRLELCDPSATVADVKRLQEALPNCQVRVTGSAGKLISVSADQAPRPQT